MKLADRMIEEEVLSNFIQKEAIALLSLKNEWDLALAMKAFVDVAWRCQSLTIVIGFRVFRF